MTAQAPMFPAIAATGQQLRDFTAHVAECEDCRATVVAAWSVSLDVTESLADLCLDGLTLLGARFERAPEVEPS